MTRKDSRKYFCTLSVAGARAKVLRCTRARKARLCISNRSTWPNRRGEIDAGFVNHYYLYAAKKDKGEAATRKTVDRNTLLPQPGSGLNP